MGRRAILYLSTLLAPFILIYIPYALYIAEGQHNKQFYQFAWYALVTIVLLMELRVRLGLSMQRGKLFYLHLIFAIPFFITLGILAFINQSRWLIITADILLLMLGLAGVILFYKSIRHISTQ